MDLPGFEPGAFRMQSERDTTTLQTLGTCLSHQLTLNSHIHTLHAHDLQYQIRGVRNWAMNGER